MNSGILDRRTWLTRTGALAALGAIWTQTPAEAHPGGSRARADLVIDVAGVGVWALLPGPPYTFPPVQATFPADLGGTDARGGSGFVEGLIYRAGTIAEPAGFDPHGTPAIGQYFGHGWFTSHLDRPIPHLVTMHEYLFGLITADNPSPADTIVDAGVEGNVQRVHRAVLGGTGRFRGARGEVRQEIIGTNTLGNPNFRMSFYL